MSRITHLLLMIFVTYFSVSIIEAPDPSLVNGKKGAHTHVKNAKGTAPFNSIGLLLSLRTNDIPAKLKGKDDNFIDITMKLWPATCTATLISPIHIITAAHCVVDPKKTDTGTKKELVQGNKFVFDGKDHEYGEKIELRWYPGFDFDVYDGSTKKANKQFTPPHGWVFKRSPELKYRNYYIQISKIQISSFYKKTKILDFNGDETADYCLARNLHQYDYAVLTLEEEFNEGSVLPLKYDPNLKVTDILKTAGMSVIYLPSIPKESLIIGVINNILYARVAIQSCNTAVLLSFAES